jgi:hypothetical protein
MNRRETRDMEKKLGLLKKKKNLPLAERLRIQREKIARGQQKGLQFQQATETQTRAEADKKASEDIYSKALTISTTEGIPFIDAMNRAKEESEKS